MRYVSTIQLKLSYRVPFLPFLVLIQCRELVMLVGAFNDWMISV